METQEDETPWQLKKAEQFRTQGNTATKKNMESWVAPWDHKHGNADEIQPVDRLDCLCCQFCIKDLTSKGAVRKDTERKQTNVNKLILLARACRVLSWLWQSYPKHASPGPATLL